MSHQDGIGCAIVNHGRQPQKHIRPHLRDPLVSEQPVCLVHHKSVGAKLKLGELARADQRACHCAVGLS